jgi:type IX secretion system PorP/SprF family membrane protein
MDKMKMMKKFLWLCLCLIAGTAKAQQDAQYSQYMFDGLYINPAYAGYKQDVYLQSFYRSQWTGLEGAPRSFSVAVDGAVNDDKVGLGLLLTQDKIGAQSSLAAYANYDYRIQIGDNPESRLSFGIGGGFIQAGLNGADLHAGQAGDNYVPVAYQSKLLPDARAGVLYTNDAFFAGFSVDNLLARHAKQDATTMVAIPKPHYYLTAGMMVDVNSDVKFKPSFLLKDDGAGPTSLDVNAFVLLGERIWIGGTYRTAVPLYAKPYLQTDLQKSNSLTGMAEIFATDHIRVGYAFDYSLTRIGTYSYGTHELSIGITFGSGSGVNSSHGLKCYF